MKRKQKATWIFIMLFAFGLFLAGHKEARAEETVVKGSYTYFAEDGIIYKMHNRTGKIKKVLKVKRSNTVEIFAVKGDWLYLTVDDYFCLKGTDKSWSYICRVKTNGKGFKELAKGDHPSIAGKYIYYVQHSFKKTKNSYSSYAKQKGIYRMSLGGSGKRKLSNPLNSYSWFQVYKKRIYCSGYKDNMTSIISVNLSGKDKKTILSGNISGLPYFYKDILYAEIWQQSSNNDIYAVNLKNGTKKYFLAGSIHGGYNGELYYSVGDYGNRTLYRCQLNKKKSFKICKKKGIQYVIGGKKWVIVTYYRGNYRQNIGVDRMKINGKSKKTLTKYFRS